DAGVADTGRPDTGPSDTSLPDFGIPFPSDAGLPDTGPSDTGTPPAQQTTVSLVMSTSQVLLDLNPPIAADPLHFSLDLTYDNVGPGSENISITSVNVMSLFTPLQTFLAGPAHNAPVGTSMQTVTKTPGSGSAIS